MLVELTWVPLSKRRENACLILFSKLSTMVPHSCIEKADRHTWKKHSMKFRHISYNMDPYGQLFFLKSLAHGIRPCSGNCRGQHFGSFKSKLSH